MYYRQHLLLAAIQGQPAIPKFDLDYSWTSNTDSMHAMKYESPLYCPQKTFDPLLQSKRLSEDTLHLLYNSKALIDLVVDFDEGAVNDASFDITFYYLKTELEHHTSAHDVIVTSERHWIFECCRLTVVIILVAIETSQPLVSSDSMFTRCLVRALEKTDIGDNWGELSGVLYWVLMVGSASCHGRPGHRLMDSTLGRTMAKLTFTALDFSSALEPIRRFSHLQRALERRNQVVAL